MKIRIHPTVQKRDLQSSYLKLEFQLEWFKINKATHYDGLRSSSKFYRIFHEFQIDLYSLLLNSNSYH